MKMKSTKQTKKWSIFRNMSCLQDEKKYIDVKLIENTITDTKTKSQKLTNKTSANQNQRAQ
jgi:hypothetical protein